MIYRPPISKDLPILIFERIFWGFIVFVTALIVSQVFSLKMGIVSSNTLTQGHLKVEISTLGYSTFYVLGAHQLPPSVFSSSPMLSDLIDLRVMSRQQFLSVCELKSIIFNLVFIARSSGAT